MRTSKLLLLLLISITFVSCYGDGIEKLKTNNDDYSVTYLFEKDGIKVYRFYDGLHYHYFTSQGETITTQRTGSSKNENLYEENIKGVIKSNRGILNDPDKLPNN
jgi:surface polysaccharide O-acyltransferase-like enzyme